MTKQATATALVTGASRGLGRAIAQAFAAAGYTTAIHFANNKDAAQRTLQSLPGEGHTLIQSPIDSAEAACDAFAAAEEAMGKVDVLVNNAGVYFDHPPLNCTIEQWSEAWTKTIGVNLMGPAYLCHAAVNHMQRIGGGSIINISSRGAYRGEPEAPAYGASKAGLNSLSQSLALACAKDNIYVYGIAPGWI
ncbi:MAG: SDR family oxidoreductase, partial [Bdellovibrionales bacterium]|nr:SDR family oxidoreductase [Bdellovibrionales bacterium]